MVIPCYDHLEHAVPVSCNVVPPDRVAVSRPRAQFPTLVDVDIDGIVIRAHELTKNVERLERILNVVGRRLAHWLKQTSDERPLPPAEWTDNFRYYAGTLTNLLKEQRERYRLTRGEDVTAEQLQAQFAIELEHALGSFTPEQRALAMRLWEANQIAEPVTKAPADA